MDAADDDFFRDLVPPESEMERIGPIYDRKTYLLTGQRSRNHLIKYAGLKPEHSVMDVGCGFGRVAIHLLRVLAPESSYLGFDVVPGEIEWCRANITPRNKRFVFEHLDVRNKSYNPAGTLRAEDIRFPVRGDAQFDVIFLFSVFTHMLPEFIAAYLAETYKYLVPGGRLFASFFLINDESRRLMGGSLRRIQSAGRGLFTSFFPTLSSRPRPVQFRFKAARGGYYVLARSDPEDAIAYDEDEVWRMMTAAGFVRDKLIYGRWPGRALPDNGQDFVVCTKPK